MPVSVVCETAASVNAALRESLGNGGGGGSCSAAANAKQSSSNQSDDSKQNGTSNNSDDIDSLHGKLVASAKRVLLSKIDYEEVTNYGQSVLDSLKSKYIVLKSTGSNNNNSMENGRSSPATCNNNGANGDSAAGKRTCIFVFYIPFVFSSTRKHFVNIYAQHTWFVHWQEEKRYAMHIERVNEYE